MQSIDIAQLLNAALQGSGYAPERLAMLDGGCTIALELCDLPSMHITEQEGEVWLWSRLGSLNDAALDRFGGSLLKSLLAGCGFARSGQLQLAQSEGELELRAQLHPDCLEDGPHFAAALNGFFDALNHFRELLL
ncbi:hypothetical protein [Chromobacterium vaccinii]|uniref:Type III secretion system chaperone SpaK n=1 Tax=Chromobacterium vaccinii TaxID=1108595 RepID=A0A1D9LNA8_9NEIS|nr:hypothetical protein [Chromobacterium vaccinii]AOZ52593.1 hypothetical protein BKX93_23005 [Chromobacterium vaccinii]